MYMKFKDVKPLYVHEKNISFKCDLIDKGFLSKKSLHLSDHFSSFTHVT